MDARASFLLDTADTRQHHAVACESRPVRDSLISKGKIKNHQMLLRIQKCSAMPYSSCLDSANKSDVIFRSDTVVFSLYRESLPTRFSRTGFPYSFDLNELNLVPGNVNFFSVDLLTPHPRFGFILDIFYSLPVSFRFPSNLPQGFLK